MIASRIVSGDVRRRDAGDGDAEVLGPGGLHGLVDRFGQPGGVRGLQSDIEGVARERPERVPVHAVVSRDELPLAGLERDFIIASRAAPPAPRLMRVSAAFGPGRTQPLIRGVKIGVSGS